MKLATDESSVLAGCLQLLRLRGHFVFRQNSGAMRTPAGGFIRFGFPGCSDLVGLARGTARFIAVETKAPRRRPTPEQVGFLEAVRAAGGLAVWVDDIDTLASVLDALEVDPAARFTISGDIDG